MSLLIKALKKAEQSKDAKAEGTTSSGLTLELAPIEDKPQVTAPSLADEAGLSAPEKAVPAAAPAEATSLSDISKPEPPPAFAEAAVASTMPEDDIAAALMEESGFSLSEEAGFSESAAVKTAKPAAMAKTEKPSKPVKNVAPQPASEKSTASTPASAEEQRSAAISLLTTRNDKKRSPGNRRSLYLGLTGLVLLLASGGGFYYYLQTLDQTQLVLIQPVPRKPLSPVTASAPISAPKAAATAVVAESATSPALPATPVAPAVESVKPADKPAMAPAPAEEPVAQAAATKPAPMQKSASSARSSRKSMAMQHQEMADQDSSMKVSRLNRGGPTTDSTQVAAYQAYQAGDDATAYQLYGKLLQKDPRNIDALLGLAAVSARQDHSSEAVNYYQQALQLDPNNNIAQEGLILLLGQANPVEAESRLKNLIAQQPDAAHLHAALGEIYIDQNRWPDAQQAYFKAFNLDPQNADYAFNLAVSLDQLKKPDLALNYYQQALTLLSKQGGTIDKTALENRINQLRAATAK